MIPIKLRLSSQIILIATVIILSGLVGYFFPHKPVVTKVPILYKVLEVIDGDTIKVEMDEQKEIVRLLGIDTPEISDECYGEEASAKTEELLGNRKVYLLPDSQGSDKDKYGRLLRYVFLPDGTFINAELIREGYAFNYIYEPFQFMKHFDYFEKQAKEKRSGLWSDECNYYFEVENQ